MSPGAFIDKSQIHYPCETHTDPALTVLPSRSLNTTSHTWPSALLLRKALPEGGHLSFSLAPQ